MRRNYIRFVVIIFLIVISLLLTSCIGELSIIRERYRKANITHYNIHKIGLLPMAMDDTTDSGTFYSTNYFFKSLKQDYSACKFNVVDIGSFVKEEPDYIKNIVQSIKREHGLSKNILQSTGLDSLLEHDSLEAVLIGTINKVNNNRYFVTHDHRLVNCKMTKCDFTYYLISLINGRILWHARTIGSAINNDQSGYPPLDVAISNGIDEFINSIPIPR